MEFSFLKLHLSFYVIFHGLRIVLKLIGRSHLFLKNIGETPCCIADKTRRIKNTITKKNKFTNFETQVKQFTQKPAAYTRPKLELTETASREVLDSNTLTKQKIKTYEKQQRKGV